MAPFMAQKSVGIMVVAMEKTLAQLRLGMPSTSARVLLSFHSCLNLLSSRKWNVPLIHEFNVKNAKTLMNNAPTKE